MNMPAKSSCQEEEKNAGQNLAASQSGCQLKWLPAKMAASQTWLLDKRCCQPNMAASYGCP